MKYMTLDTYLDDPIRVIKQVIKTQKKEVVKTQKKKIIGLLLFKQGTIFKKSKETEFFFFFEMVG